MDDDTSCLIRYQPFLRTSVILHLYTIVIFKGVISRVIALKDKDRCFNFYYLSYRYGLSVLLEWLAMFVLYYNHARYHQTLKGPPVPLGSRYEYERWEVALLAALSLS